MIEKNKISILSSFRVWISCVNRLYLIKSPSVVCFEGFNFLPVNQIQCKFSDLREQKMQTLQMFFTDYNQKANKQKPIQNYSDELTILAWFRAQLHFSQQEKKMRLNQGRIYRPRGAAFLFHCRSVQNTVRQAIQKLPSELREELSIAQKKTPSCMHAVEWIQPVLYRINKSAEDSVQSLFWVLLLAHPSPHSSHMVGSHNFEGLWGCHFHCETGFPIFSSERMEKWNGWYCSAQAHS